MAGDSTPHDICVNSTHVYDPNAVDTPHDRIVHGMGDSLLQRVTYVLRPTRLLGLKFRFNYVQGQIHHPIFVFRLEDTAVL